MSRPTPLAHLPAVPAEPRIVMDDGILRRNLVIGASNDRFEREADRMADHVSATPSAPANSAVVVQVQRLATMPGAADGIAPASVDAALSATGAQLEPALRGDMERRFGHDFSRVRVHTDLTAARSAQDVNARAYTIGRDIVFAANQYAPVTLAGRHVLAHELTHVRQQTGSGGAGPVRLQRDHGKTQAPPKVVAPVAANKTQQKMFDDARRAAAIRTQIAMFRATGIEGQLWSLEAHRLAELKFDWVNPNMDQVGEILRAMGGGLINVDVKVAGVGDPECGSRSGYVRGHRQPIALCPGFFRHSDPAHDEGRIRTMIHEMAHVVGIGDASLGEQYFPVFDCSSKGDFGSADSWANYVNCLSGQTPDKPITIIGHPGGSGTPSSPPKSGAKK